MLQHILGIAIGGQRQVESQHGTLARAHGGDRGAVVLDLGGHHAIHGEDAAGVDGVVCRRARAVGEDHIRDPGDVEREGVPIGGQVEADVRDRKDPSLVFSRYRELEVHEIGSAVREETVGQQRVRGRVEEAVAVIGPEPQRLPGGIQLRGIAGAGAGVREREAREQLGVVEAVADQQCDHRHLFRARRHGHRRQSLAGQGDAIVHRHHLQYRTGQGEIHGTVVAALHADGRVARIGWQAEAHSRTCRGQFGNVHADEHAAPAEGHVQIQVGVLPAHAGGVEFAHQGVGRSIEEIVAIVRPEPHGCDVAAGQGAAPIVDVELAQRIRLVAVGGQPQREGKHIRVPGEQTHRQVAVQGELGGGQAVHDEVSAGMHGPGCDQAAGLGKTDGRGLDDEQIEVVAVAGHRRGAATKLQGQRVARRDGQVQSGQVQHAVAETGPALVVEQVQVGGTLQGDKADRAPVGVQLLLIAAAAAGVQYLQAGELFRAQASIVETQAEQGLRRGARQERSGRLVGHDLDRRPRRRSDVDGDFLLRVSGRRILGAGARGGGQQDRSAPRVRRSPQGQREIDAVTRSHGSDVPQPGTGVEIALLGQAGQEFQLYGQRQVDQTANRAVRPGVDEADQGVEADAGDGCFVRDPQREPEVRYPGRHRDLAAVVAGIRVFLGLGQDECGYRQVLPAAAA